MANKFTYSQLTSEQKQYVAEHLALYEAQRSERYQNTFENNEDRFQTSREAAVALNLIDFRRMSKEDIQDLAGRMEAYTDPNHKIYDNIPGNGASTEGIKSLENAIDVAGRRPRAFRNRMEGAANHIANDESAEMNGGAIVGVVIDGATLGSGAAKLALDATRGLALDQITGEKSNPAHSLPFIGGLIKIEEDVRAYQSEADLGNLAPPKPANNCIRNFKDCLSL